MKNLPKKNTHKATFLIAATVLLFLATYCLRQNITDSVSLSLGGKNHPEHPQRIIALAPSLVETVYQLELDNRLVGVSRFCRYPEDATTKPEVGGYLDLDFEALLKLRPDCVILLQEQHLLTERLNKLGIETISVNHASTEGIISSITRIGDACGKSHQANMLVEQIHQRIQKIQSLTKKNASPPRVLVCISRDTSSAHPDRIIAAGNSGVHQEYITMAGGINAYSGPISYPSISREKLIQINPDIIIDLITEENWQRHGEQQLLQQWLSYPELKAVKNQRIIFLHEHKHLIPGPRFTETLAAFTSAIHPNTP